MAEKMSCPFCAAPTLNTLSKIHRIGTEIPPSRSTESIVMIDVEGIGLKQFLTRPHRLIPVSLPSSIPSKLNNARLSPNPHNTPVTTAF